MLKVSQDKDKPEVTLREQMKKFAIKSLYGYQTILCYGLGGRLGIFDYFYKKAKSEITEQKITAIKFTLEELSENLKLDLKYLDGWFHMSLECGIFEIEDRDKKIAKTAPHVYELLIDKESMFYMGGTIRVFHEISLNQDLLLDHFKTGQIDNILETPSDDYKEGQRASARVGTVIESLFKKYCKDDRKKLQNLEAKILEVGCGYGFNLEIWAKKYRKAQFVGIDIDPNGVAYAKELMKQNKWSDRINIYETTLENYLNASDTKFDMIMLNEVLHEMDPDENYRKSVFDNIHSLLKDDGIFIVGESMIPDTFEPKEDFQLFNIMHKWLEVAFGSKFYNEKTFKELVDSSSFNRAELIKEGGNYFWAIRK